VSALRTQLTGVAKRPARLLLTGLSVLIASFVVYMTVLAHQTVTATMVDRLSGTPSAVDLVVEHGMNTDLLDRARKIPGVAEAQGRGQAGYEVAGRSGESLVVDSDPGAGPLARVRTIAGSYPDGPGEIVVSERTKQRMALDIGKTVTLAVPADDPTKQDAEGREVTLTVTGIAVGAVDRGFNGWAPTGTVAAIVPGGRLDRIELRFTPGTSVDSVRSALAPIVDEAPKDGPQPTISTGAAIRELEMQQVSSEVDEIFLLVAVFILIAVIAAALVATSTFRIVFAQRMRQLALLRAVGAGRGPLSRALVAEGALTGLVAGTTGVVLALALGLLAVPVADWAGFALSAPGVPVLPAVAVVLGAGLITIGAVLAPAFSAAKVSPLEALRASSTTTSTRTLGRGRAVVGVLLLLAGSGAAGFVLVTLPTPDTKNYHSGTALVTVVLSGMLTFLALIALGPLLVGPVLRAVSWPVRRLGPVGRLAVGGIGGAPKRAAAVSIVVALGVTLVAGTLVGASSLRSMALGDLAAASPSDFEMIADDAGLADGTVAKAAASADLKNVVPYWRTEVPAGDLAEVGVAAVDLTALPSLAAARPDRGSLAATGPGTVVLSGWLAANLDAEVGRALTVRFAEGAREMRVAAIMGGDAPIADIVVNPADRSAFNATGEGAGLLADAAQTGEKGRAAAQTALRGLSPEDRPAQVVVLADERDEYNSAITILTGIAVGLIGLTVIIAVVGVGTTTALSVVERVRESGLLRAVGLSRRGLRTMLTTESSLYGVIGATIGLLLGVPYAWLALQTLNLRAPFELPYLQLLLVFVTLVVFTALAGVLPARRAATVSPVVALATDG
jgi:putative ABC transport system permease protein